MAGPDVLILKAILGEDAYYFKRMITIIIHDVTWDYCGWWRYLWADECIVDSAGAEEIINVYMRYVKNEKVLGWIYDFSPEERAILGILLPVWPDNDRILRFVANSAGQTTRTVRIVLNALWTATLENRLESARFLRPYTWDVTRNDRAQHEEYKNGGLLKITEDLMAALKKGLDITAFLLPVAVVGAASFYGYKVYNEAFG